jgi:hypothetical protein
MSIPKIWIEKMEKKVLIKHNGGENWKKLNKKLKTLLKLINKGTVPNSSDTI